MIGKIEIFCDLSCPVQCDEATRENRLRLLIGLKTQAAENILMGENLLADTILETLMRETPPPESMNTVEDVKAEMRQLAAEEIDVLEAKADEIMERREELSQFCAKAAVTQVSTTNGQRITTTVCTSTIAYDGYNRHIPVHVDRAFEL